MHLITTTHLGRTRVYHGVSQKNQGGEGIIIGSEVTVMSDNFDEFARKREQTGRDSEQLRREAKPEWERLKSLMSELASDGKGIDGYRFEWTTDLTGNPMLVLNNVSATLSVAREQGKVPQGQVRFTRRPAGVGEGYPDESRVPARTWSLEPMVENGAFLWFVFERAWKISPAELKEEIAKELARYHIEYEKACGLAS